MSTDLAPNLEQIFATLRPAAERLAGARGRRRRVKRTATAGVAAVALGGSVAVAGIELLGDAPPRVQRDLAGVDQGMPEDLRLNPDIEHARRVAVSGDAEVWFAPLASGGYCAELVTSGRARGAVCSTPAETERTAVGVTIPFTDPVTDASPVTVTGRVSAPGAVSVRLVYPDGGSDTVDLSPSRFYIAEVPAAHLASVHRRGLMVLALDADGRSVAQAVVPFDAITPPAVSEGPHDPIELDTLSDSSDFTLLRGARGKVYADGAVAIRLVYPDGETLTERLGAGGRYRLDIPAGRQHDFARRAGKLQALAAGGRVLAERPIASVAWWRATRRSSPSTAASPGS